MSTVKNLVKNFERGDAASANSAVKDLVRRIDSKVVQQQPAVPKPSQVTSAPEESPVENPVIERSESSETSPDITKEEEEDLELDDDEDVEVSSTGTGPIIVDEIPQVSVTEGQDTFQGVIDDLEDP